MRELVSTWRRPATFPRRVQERARRRSLRLSVFPQEELPFPRDDVARRWREELAAPGIDCYVVIIADAVVGFAAIRKDEILHFGVAIEHWGTGIA